MGVVVGFDYRKFQVQFPEFNNTVTGDTAATLFDMATVYHANDGSGRVATPNVQSLCLNLVVAHLAMLFYGTDADPASSLVGRVISASEGSVSVSVEGATGGDSPSKEWWVQTKYGAAYWAATVPFRMMRYFPGPRRVMNPFPFR